MLSINFVFFFVLILRLDVTTKSRIGTSMGLSCRSASASKEFLTLTMGATASVANDLR